MSAFSDVVVPLAIVCGLEASDGIDSVSFDGSFPTDPGFPLDSTSSLASDLLSAPSCSATFVSLLKNDFKSKIPLGPSSRLGDSLDLDAGSSTDGSASAGLSSTFVSILKRDFKSKPLLCSSVFLGDSLDPDEVESCRL